MDSLENQLHIPNNFTILNRSGKLPDCIICLNGTLPETHFFSSYLHLPIIAADGATQQLIQRSIIPTVVIGDFDSVDKSLLTQYSNTHGVVTVHQSDQNTTDFEKCLNYCLESSLNNILICGFHGGELEHTLNNWSILQRYSRRSHIVIFDESRFGLIIDKSIRFETIPEETISLIPCSQALLTTQGLKWNLTRETLALSYREGGRNKAQGKHVTLELHKGLYMLFIQADKEKIPFFQKHLF